MTVYGDLEISTLRQLPSGRGGVSSSVVPVREKPAWLDRAWERLREEVAAGRQAYVVCPRIGDETGPDDEPEDADGAPGRRPASDRRPPLAVLDIAELLRTGPAGRAAARRPARPADPGGEGRPDAGLRRPGDRRPRRHHRGRGRRRRARTPR